MKKISAIISTLLCLALLLVLLGCAGVGGGGGAPADAPDEAEAPTEADAPDNGDDAATPPSDDEHITVVFTHWGSPFERDVLDIASRTFEQNNPHITIDNQFIPNVDYAARIATMLAGNIQLDSGFLSDTDIHVWGTDGRIANIYNFVDADPNLSRDDFIDHVFYLTDDPEVSWGFFISSQPRAMFFNKDLFDASGVEYPPHDRLNPLTWEEFLYMAQRLTLDSAGNNALDPNFNPDAIVQYGFTVGAFALYQYLPIIYQAGGRVFDEDGEFIFNSPEVALGLQNIQDLIFVYNVMPHPTILANMPAGVIALSAGQVAIMASGHWNLLDLGQFDFRFDSAVLPVMGNVREFYVTNDCAPMVVFNGPHEQEAYEFLIHLLDPVASPDPFTAGLWLPILRSGFTQESLDEWAVGPAHLPGFFGTFVEPMLYGPAVLPFHFWSREKTPELTTMMNTRLEAVMLEGASIPEILDQIEEEARIILGR